MDALEFINERDRMCKYIDRCCNDCPANNIDDCIAAHWDEEIVPIVEKWSKENPRKTRQRAFLKQYPYAKCVDGIVAICPKMIDASLSCPGRADIDCPDCRREFWMQEIE